MSTSGRQTGPALRSTGTVQLSSSRWLSLLVLCVGFLMIILDSTIVNVALPSIRRDLGFSAADLQWVVNAYALAFAGFLMLGGRAADLLGQRPVFAAGLGLFGLASLLGGLATSDAMLVVARTVQGLGGAIVAPATLAVGWSTARTRRPASRADSSVCPTAATWGSVKTTRGETGPSAMTRESRPRITSAATRAWYLPM